jgi:hypothetical protein
MRSAKPSIEQVRSLCRHYPAKVTACELVGKTYLILNERPAGKELTALLVEQLRPNELGKLIAAAAEVFRACDSFSTVQGFELGAVSFPGEGESSKLALDERFIPAEFVKALMHCDRPATGRSA